MQLRFRIILELNSHLTMSDLLEQAIADAKAIRDAAIENAKATLAESFEPQIKSMIKARLMEQEDMEEEDQDVIEDGYSAEDEEDLMGEVNLDEIMDELQNEINSSRVDEDMNMMLEELEDDLYESEGTYADDNDEDILEGMLDEVDEDLDEEMLESILYEMDDSDESQAMEEALSDLESDLMDSEETISDSYFRTGRSYLFENDDEEGEDDLEMEEDDTEMVDEDEDVLPSLDELTPEEVEELSKPEMKQILLQYLSGHGMASATGAEDEIPSEEEVREAVEAVLAEMHPSDVMALEEAVLGPNPRKSVRNSSNSRTSVNGEVRELRGRLQESNQAVRELQATLNEVGLVNSKLLYTGKLFRAHNNLSEKQKVTILEYFDRVDNLEDVKSLYSKFVRALVNRNTSTASAPRELSSKNSVPRLTESNASRTAGGSTRPTQILQEDRMIARWQQLAGIIK